MKAEFLYISELYLLHKDNLEEGIQEEEIIYKTNDLEPEYFTPGTAYYESNKKMTTSGFYYTNEIVFSVPGFSENQFIEKVNNAGAVVGVMDTGRKIVLYKNDYFSNTAFLPEINRSQTKTTVKYSMMSLDVL